MGLGWKSSYGSGKGGDTITSGLEGAWTPTPTAWDNTFFDTLFGYDWDLTKSPAGAWQWVPTSPAAQEPSGRARPRADPTPACSPPTWRCASTRSTSPSRGFLEHPDEFARPSPRRGSSSPTAIWARCALPRAGGSRRAAIWQDPVPKVDHDLIDAADIAALKAKSSRRA